MTLGNPDPKFWRRLLLAFALAVAVHEIGIGLGGLFRFPHAQAPPEQAMTGRPIQVTLVRPTPKPTPTPTPAPRVTPAPKRAVAAPRATTIAKKTGGSHGGPKIQIQVPKTVYHSTPVPVVHATASGSKIVADTGTGASPTPGPAAGIGAGTGTGTGSGSAQGPGGGTGGSGSGAANADVPCGEPIFYGLHAKYNQKDGSFDESVRVELHMANGQTLSGEFHYPWHYPSESENPFSPNWHGGPDDPIPAKLPPAGFDVSKEPLAVQLTLKNTLPNGTTRFQPCPSAKSP